MNIFAQESELVTAKTCGCRDKTSITYAFSESFHGLCMDKKAVIEAEIQACERLLKYAPNESERSVVEKEIRELRMALDLLT
jgi:hypothetical protein